MNTFPNIVRQGIDLFIAGVDKYKRPLLTEIREKMILKHKLCEIYIWTHSDDNHRVYKKITKDVKCDIKRRDKAEQNGIADESKANPKKFQNFVKSTIHINNIRNIKYINQKGKCHYKRDRRGECGNVERVL